MDKIQVGNRYKSGVFPTSETVEAVARALQASAKGRSTSMKQQVSEFLKYNPIPQNGDWLIVTAYADVFTIGMNAGKAPKVSCRVRYWQPNKERILAAWEKVKKVVAIHDETSVSVLDEPDVNKWHKNPTRPRTKADDTWVIEGMEIYKTSNKLYTFTIDGEKYNLSPSNLPKIDEMTFGGWEVDCETGELRLP